MHSPESIAEVVVWAAEHAPREMLIGRPTVQSVLAQKLVPGLLDRFLGRKGVEAQLTDVTHDPTAPGILFETLPGDPGAHGPYRDRERGPDLQMRLRTHPRSIAAAGLATAATGLTVWWSRRHWC